MPVIFLHVGYWLQFKFPTLENVQKNWKGSEEGREGQKHEMMAFIYGTTWTPWSEEAGT